MGKTSGRRQQRINNPEKAVGCPRLGRAVSTHRQGGGLGRSKPALLPVNINTGRSNPAVDACGSGVVAVQTGKKGLIRFANFFRV